MGLVTEVFMLRPVRIIVSQCLSLSFWTFKPRRSISNCPSSITLNKEINKTGNYKAKINLHSEIESEILIEVVNESDKEK